MEENSFMTLGAKPNVIKLYSVFYEFS